MIYAAMPCLGLPHFFRFVTVRRLHLWHEAFCSLARHIPHPASKDLCSSGSLGNDSKQPWRLSLYFFSPQGSGDNPVVRDAPDIFAGAGWQEVFFLGFVWHYWYFHSRLPNTDDLFGLRTWASMCLYISERLNQATHAVERYDSWVAFQPLLQSPRYGPLQKRQSIK